MGQKVNPIIFRLGKTKQWKSQYFEKKPTDQPIYTFNDLEIRKFISKFLEKHGLMTHDCKLYYSNNSLHIYVSYFLAAKAISLINSVNKDQKVRLVANEDNFKQSKRYKNKYRAIRSKIENYLNYNDTIYKKEIKNFGGKAVVQIAKRVIRQEEQSLKIRRLKLLQFYKKFAVTKNYRTINNIKNNSFLEKILETLTLFTNKKFNIFLTFHQLNKNIKQGFDFKKQKVLKKSLVQLRKYKQNEFFKEGVNVLYTTIVKDKSSDLLAQFIANVLKRLKRHTFFLKFVETTLKLFTKKKFSNIEGIKIRVKGRFNGAPRAKYKIITIGKGTPTLTLNTNLDYSEKTSFTSNGTFGVKVWTSKHKNDYVKRTKKKQV